MADCTILRRSFYNTRRKKPKKQVTRLASHRPGHNRKWQNYGKDFELNVMCHRKNSIKNYILYTSYYICPSGGLNLFLGQNKFGGRKAENRSEKQKQKTLHDKIKKLEKRPWTEKKCIKMKKYAAENGPNATKTSDLLFFYTDLQSETSAPCTKKM